MKKITVIVSIDCVEKLEACLRGTGVHGLTMTEVQGYGEHANFFHRDLTVSNVQIDIYTGPERADSVVETIINFQSDDYTPMGLLAVESVERLVNLHTGEDISAEDY